MFVPTNTKDSIELRLLGPLEARVGNRALDLGGAKQRAVLGALLLHVDEVVPVEQLIDDVWGGSVPTSARHGLEAYVSRIRRAISQYGPSLERRGDGYRLQLGGAFLDSGVFERLLDEAEVAFSSGVNGRAADLAERALSLWRGPPLADVQLCASGGAEARRLEELRLRAIEIKIDADLGRGRHERVIPDLQRLVGTHSYRERFVKQLMLALYRSGRHVEALDVYGRFRRALADDLGLQPSGELQQLSGQLVRHEPEVAGPAPSVSETRSRPTTWRNASVRSILLGAIVVVGLAAGLAWILSHGTPGGVSATRVALVIPRELKAGREDTYVAPFVDGLLGAEQEYRLETKTLVLDPSHPEPASLERVSEDLGNGDFDLVLWAGLGPAEWKLAPLADRLPGTRFVYIDASLAGTPLEGTPNMTAMSFDDEQAGYLVGYLSALVEPRGASRNGPRLSVVGGMRIPVVTGLVEGFARGARAARPGTVVDVSYSGSFVDESICERIANRQIDGGSDVVFAAAGTCGFGALSAAAIRGVWAVGADADRSYLGSHILASTVKRYDRAVQLAVQGFVNRTLPSGHDVELGLDNDAVGITGISVDVPPSIRKRVARIAAALRAEKRSTK
jgi:basic membrane lipoprotein Med (substrate-binding protein (PBP1-ABC) superfamily)/DNA-binding SARP family transcriptional activator